MPIKILESFLFILGIGSGGDKSSIIVIGMGMVKYAWYNTDSTIVKQFALSWLDSKLLLYYYFFFISGSTHA